MSRPSVLPVKLENIPAELKTIDRWVMWRLVQKTKPNGEKVWTKVPFAVDGSAGSSTNSTTWSTYDDVCDALIMGGNFDGIGFVLGDDIQGIDLDDCRDPQTGELTELAVEVLADVDGYAEVSPSGTGIKVFARTNLDGSRTKKEVGVELYCSGRYFTVTGHAIGSAHLEKINDLEWLVQKVWGETITAGGVLTGDAGEMALANLKSPLEDWDIDRVADEILAHLDPDCGYEDWLKVGAILHHQGEGDPAWLDLWDNWSAGSGKWVEGYCEEKWASFSTQRAVGRGAATLASLIKQTKDKRDAANRSERDQMIVDLLAKVEAVADPRDLQEKIAAAIAHNGDFTDVERAQFAQAIQVRARVLGTKLEIGTVRGWLRPRVKASFPHLNDDGHPLCTIENLRVLLQKLGVIVRYNVISKATEILIPDSQFSRDNRDNVALGYVFSQCEQARMSTKYVPQFLLMMADENLYNPVSTWIESKPWDGVSRLNAFYDTVDCGGQMDEKLKHLLMRKWLIQAIGAAFEPDGIAAQGILTFTGKQNIGKTTWFKRLAPEELNLIYTGHTLDVRSKDSQLIALKYWIVELGEIDATFRKSDVAALKSFATQALDNIRRPYAMTESTYGRRTVFGASVNDGQFLADPTGNRRFWTVPAVMLFLDHNIDTQQLWAEVFERWKAGEKWYLNQKENSELSEHNDDYTVVDPIDERIAGGFCWGEAVKVWDWVTATELLMRIGVKEPSKQQTITASRTVKRLNGDQRKKSNGKVLFAVPSDANDFLG
jgi:putative DNA primase/helicase